MTFLQLQVFIKLVETGSFTKTGEKLNLSQSGVSHAIASLEKELGKILFNRSRGTVHLTDEGEYILHNVKEILYHEELIYQKLLRTSESQKRTIKIGTFPSGTHWLLKSVIPLIKEKVKNIQLSIKEGTYIEIEKWVKNKELDFGIITSVIDKSIPYLQLFDDPLLVVVSKKHPLAVRQSCELEVLEEFPFIMPIAGCQQQITKAFEERGLRLNIIMELKETQTLLDMVSENIGITILPKMAIRNTHSEVVVLPICPSLKREVGAIAISPNNKDIQNILGIIKMVTNKD